MPTNDECFARMLEWEITRGCEMRCIHCYNRPNRPREGELDEERALMLARRLPLLGCGLVMLSGGEPTLRRDLPRIAETLASAGVRVQVATHGMSMDQALARTLRSAGVSLVVMSLDGVGDIHDCIRGKVGAYCRLLESCEAVSSVGMGLGLSTVLLRPNQHELPAVAEVVNQVGALYWSVWMGMRRSPRPIWLRPTDMAQVLRDVEWVRDRCSAFVAGDNLPVGSGGGGWTTRCRGGVCGAAIRSDGKVTSCIAMPEHPPAGDLLHHDPVAIADALAEQRRDRVERLLRHPTAAWMGLGAHGCHATMLGGMESAPLQRRPGISRVAGLAATLVLPSLVLDCSRQPPATRDLAMVDSAPSTSMPGAMQQEPSSAPVAGDASAPTAADAASLVTDTGAGSAVQDSAMADAPTDAKPKAHRKPLPACCLSHMIVDDCVCR